MILASSTSNFVSYMSAGISEGSITALAALGFLLTHKATGVISFAQGAFVTLGAYIAVWASHDQGWPLLLADLFAIAAMFVVGVASERIAYRPLRGRSIHVVVIATFGISEIVIALTALDWADRCLLTCRDHGLDDFDLAYALEIRARSSAGARPHRRGRSRLGGGAGRTDRRSRGRGVVRPRRQGRSRAHRCSRSSVALIAFALLRLAPITVRNSRRPRAGRVELLGHPGVLLVDRIQQVAPDVAAEVPPGDPVRLVELDHLVQDLVRQPDPHLHPELGAGRQPLGCPVLHPADAAGAVDLAVPARRGQQVEDLGGGGGNRARG